MKTSQGYILMELFGDANRHDCFNYEYFLTYEYQNMSIQKKKYNSMNSNL